MNESEAYARIRALAQLLNELKAKLAAMEARLAAAEQVQSQRWNGAGQ